MAATPSKAEPMLERRRTVRRQVAAGTVFRIPSNPDNTKVVGLVWNISTSGVSMLLGNSHQRGETIRGELGTMDNRFKLPIAVQVAHVRQIQTGDYFVGAQFEQRLSDEQLRPFLFS